MQNERDRYVAVREICVHLCPATPKLRFSAIIRVIKPDADQFKCIFLLHKTLGANGVLRFFISL